tara:strand:- start:28 stop:450 length:423 start_codon:yes stop_codon:yes gene_type:complete
MPNDDSMMKDSLPTEMEEEEEVSEAIPEEGMEESMEAGSEEETTSFDTPADALGAAIEEHGADDPAKLVEWLQEYGYELTSGPAEVAIGVGVGLPEEGDDGGEMAEMGGGILSIETMRNGAAERAFDKFKKGEVPKGRYS